MSDYQGDHWFQMSSNDFLEWHRAAKNAMFEEEGNQARYLRHLMNAVLFQQLYVVRLAVEEGSIQPATVSTLLHSEFGLGYLFGLAANFVDSCSLPRQSTEAKAAIYDVHVFTFGEKRGQKIITEQDGRSPSSFGVDYRAGVEAAQKDVNAVKRALKGEGKASTGLLLGMLDRVSTSQ